jgi:hypothetical protein
MKGSLPFSIVIALSTFLLFLVQPLFAKLLLPWFGGSSAVWSVCLVFFQGTLLLGYLYADQVTRKLSPRKGFLLHAILFLLCIPLLPLSLDAAFQPRPGEDPAWKLLGLLVMRLGLPFFLLSSTSPLVQAWFARTQPGQDPYRLFAWSNAASLTGLLVFPFLLEPFLGTTETLGLWSGVFAVFSLLCLGLAWTSGKTPYPATSGASPSPEWGSRLAWIGLSACGSMLLVAITEHLTQDVAPLPLLWVAPLALYLSTFILAFGKKGQRPWGWVLFPLAPLWVVLNVAFYDPYFLSDWTYLVALECAGLFLGCLFCHGELSRLRPAAPRLTGYYLDIALGGALGALLVGWAAPKVFPLVLEYPLSLMAVTGAVFFLYFRRRGKGRAFWLGILLYQVLTLSLHIKTMTDESLALRRNFYAALRVVLLASPWGDKYLNLSHGMVAHGRQFIDPAKQSQGTAYYSPGSGAALAMRFGKGPKKVGMVGLGTGTLALYGRPGGSIRFYEINPQVLELAQRYFSFLSLSPSSVTCALGDARLVLEREPPNDFDVLAVDAFSGDSIPSHLLTREAFALYQRHLKPNGILAFHTSNRHLKLGLIVLALAKEEGYEAMVVRNPKDEEGLVDVTEWVLVTKDQAFLKAIRKLVPGPQPKAREGLRAWTDDHHSLFPLLR